MLKSLQGGPEKAKSRRGCLLPSETHRVRGLVPQPPFAQG